MSYTAFLERLGLTVPIMQAPMAGVSTARMAAAVASVGGLGSLAMAAADLTKNVEPVFDEIAKFRKLAGPSPPVNVNFFAHDPAEQQPPTEEQQQRWYSAMAVAAKVSERELRRALPKFERVNVSFREFEATAGPGVLESFFKRLGESNVRVVSFHFGLPSADTVRVIHRNKMEVFACVTSVREAEAAVEVGADCLVCQGWEAGGHRGVFLSPASAWEKEKRETEKREKAGDGVGAEGEEAGTDVGAGVAAKSPAEGGSAAGANSSGERESTDKKDESGTLQEKKADSSASQPTATSSSVVGADGVGADDEQLSTRSLFEALKPLASTTGTSLIAAGGIVDAESAGYFLQNGAAAVAVGTLLVTTEESSAPPFLGRLTAENTETTKIPSSSLPPTVMTSVVSGKIARAVKTPFLEALIEAAKDAPLPSYGYSYWAYKAAAKEKLLPEDSGFYLSGESYGKVVPGGSAGTKVASLWADTKKILETVAPESQSTKL